MSFTELLIIVLCATALILISLKYKFLANELARVLFGLWDRHKSRWRNYSHTELHLWDRRNNRPAYTEFKKYASARQIYHQDYIGYAHFPTEGLYFNINRHGFRSPDFELRKSKNDPRLRVLMFGASALEGVPNCADDEIISHHLQELCNKHDLPVEVINLGVRSYRNINELNLLYRMDAVVDFDAIIVFDGYADFALSRTGNLFNGYPRVHNFISEAWMARLEGDVDWFNIQEVLIKKAITASKYPHYQRMRNIVTSLIDKMAIGRNEVTTKSSDSIPRHHDVGRDIYLRFSEYFMMYAKKRGKPILFCHQPALLASLKPLHENEQIYLDYLKNSSKEGENGLTRFGDYYKLQISALEELCDAEQVPFINGQEVVDCLGAEEDVYFDGIHMNSNGNACIAKKMLPVVESWAGARGEELTGEDHG